MNRQKFGEFFLDDKEIWKNTLTKLQNFILTHQVIPSIYSTVNHPQSIGYIEELYLAKWLIKQLQHNKRRTELMIDDRIYETWKQFMANNSEYFLNDKQKWTITLEKAKTFITNFQRRPKLNSINTNEHRLASWINTQFRNTKDGARIGIMSEDDIYGLWNEFISI